MTYPFTTGMRLDVEDPSLIPSGKVLNLIQNPNGFIDINHPLGGYGWVTPSTGTVGSVGLSGSVPSLRFQTATSGPAFFHSEPAPVTPGDPFSASWIAPNAFATFWHRGTVQFLDDTGAVVTYAGGGNATGILAGHMSTVQSLSSLTVPAGAVQARIRFDVYGTSGGANPTSSLVTNFRSVRMGPDATPTNIIDGPFYTDVLTSSASITVEREALNVGTLTAFIPDIAYDPTLNELLRAGRRVRLVAIHEPEGGGVGTGDHVIFTGEVTTASVAYDLLRTGAGRAQITLNAVDHISRLANAIRPNGYDEGIDGLRAVVEGAGVPWRINGSRDQIAPPVTITRNESASALDQIALVRDSQRCYAWMTRDGVINAWDPGTWITNPGYAQYEFWPEDYGVDIDVSFSTEHCINVVTIKHLRKNLANGETVEVPYGPYVHQASVAEWGPYSAEFTVQGLTDDDAAMRAFADAVFAENAEPAVSVNSITFCVEGRHQVTAERALVDFYDQIMVFVPEGGNPSSLIGHTRRTAKITHRITPDNWLVDLSFEPLYGVAAPQQTPPVQNGTTGGVLYPGPQAGIVSVGSLVTGTNVTQAVTFAEPYPVAPTVVVSPGTGAPQQFDVSWSGVSETGFTARVTRRSGSATSLSVSWIAV